jgi:hypothetical protein
VIERPGLGGNSFEISVVGTSITLIRDIDKARSKDFNEWLLLKRPPRRPPMDLLVSTSDESAASLMDKSMLPDLLRRLSVGLRVEPSTRGCGRNLGDPVSMLFGRWSIIVIGARAVVELRA